MVHNNIQHSLLPTPCDMEHYPRPAVPIHPILSAKSLSLLPFKSPIQSIFSAESTLFLTSGRMGIAYILQKLKVGKGDKVLIPAYHCSSMVEPVVWLGAQPVFYKINKDTSIDLQDVDSKLDENTKIIMVTHYFGFHQPLNKIRKYCDDNNLQLLEDCAHAAFGIYDGKPLGSYGDFAIASAMKFYPVYDGGCLVRKRLDTADDNVVSAGIKFEIKACFNILERSFAYNRLPVFHYTFGILFKIKDYIWGKIKSSRTELRNDVIGPQASDGGYGFDAEWVNIKISYISKLLLKLTSTKRLIKSRHLNYLRLHQSFKDLEGVTPLFKNLPDGVVPYVYPLIVDEARTVFPDLKYKGVPIIRFGEFLWEGVDKAVCSNSAYLSDHVFQFPCHQEITQRELTFIINTVIDTVSKHQKSRAQQSLHKTS